MRETPDAKQAWNDYLAMGPERSLEKLLVLYQGGTKAAPTRRLRTLKDWSRFHGWDRRLAEIAEQEHQAIVRRGIADKQNRIDALNDRWQRLHQVIEERGADPEMEDVPGGRTGLLVHQVKIIGAGDNAQRIDEYKVDDGTLDQFLKHEKQAAQELGQWVEKGELTGASGKEVVFRVVYGDPGEARVDGPAAQAAPEAGAVPSEQG